MYIILAILAFGLMVFIHELGHFTVAKLCGVRVMEFSLGMGPLLWSHQGKETLYSLRALPIGGFCAMEGETEASDDPMSFSNQPEWKRLLIFLAGAVMNFILGLLIVISIYSSAQGFLSPVISGFFNDCPYYGDFQEGDRISRINGKRVFFLADFTDFLAEDADGIYDFVLKRDGKKIRLDGYSLAPVEYQQEDGSKVLKYGFYFATEEKTVGSVLRYSVYTCCDFVRMIRQSLVQLISGEQSMKNMAGVVGIVDIINETGQSAPSVAEGIEDIAYLIAFISVNLSVMNLLPLPALDGGHILTMYLGAAYEKIFRKKPDPGIEKYIHAAGFALLLLLMAVIFYNDIIRIITR